MTPHHVPRMRRRMEGDHGSIAVYTAVVTIVLLGIIGLVLDGGGKLRATERADALAIEASRAAGQAIDPARAITGRAIRVDPQAAAAAALAYLHQAGAAGQVSISPDRTRLAVTVHGVYETKFLPVVGITSMPVTGHGTATLLHGVLQPQKGPRS
jgi:Flp pilus assembly protein TadG